MKQSDIPSRFNKPFANAASGSYIRTIPDAHVASTGTDAPASLADGFPPECFQPIGSGGIPPNGKDFNGILNRITAWSRWQAAGSPAVYSSAFSTAIGGYPKGAKLDSTALSGVVWISLVDDNTTDPDGGSPSGWAAMGLPLNSLLNANPGYRVHADGYKECWGNVSVPPGGTAFVSLPYTHSSWFNVSIAAETKNTAQAQFNTALLGKSGLAGFTISNWENVYLNVDWSTRGV